MAQLLVPPAPGSERISQILPTVKCSDCNEPVRISELGSHVCASVPPVPKLPAHSPRFVTDFLPTKLRDFVNPPTPTPSLPPRSASLAQSPPRHRTSTSASPPHPSRRSRASSSASSMSSRSTDSSRPSLSSLFSRENRDSGKVPFPVPPLPSEPPRIPSPAVPARSPTSPGTERAHTPGAIPPPGTTALRPRAPSTTSLRPIGLRDGAQRQPAMSSPSPYNGPRVVPPPPSSPPNIRQRAGTSAVPRPSFDQGPEIIYSTDMRPRTPMVDPIGTRALSAASVRPPPSLGQQMRPSMDQPRPSLDSRPSVDQMRRPFGEQPRLVGPPSPVRAPSAPPPPLSTPPIEPDTQSGGAAGMAGVGRRGFAAAARAAMFTHMGPGPMGTPPMSPAPDMHTRGGPLSPNQGMDGRRANAPRFLDIASATRYAATTPPLSPGSGTASISPHSPFSQQSPGLSGLPSPDARMSPSITPTAPAAGIASSSPPSPTGVSSLRDRVVPPPPQDAPKVPAAESQTPRLPFFEKFKNKLPNVDTAKAAEAPEPSPLSASSDDDSSYGGGLAYADSDDEEDGTDIPFRSSPPPISSGTAPAKAAPAPTTGKVRFPSMTSSKYSSGLSSSNAGGSSSSPPRLPQRSLSSSSSSTTSSRTIARSTGALDRAMETLFELQDADDGDDVATSSSSSATFAGGELAVSPPPRERESVALAGKGVVVGKLPTRAHTSPTLPAGRHEHQRRSGAAAAEVAAAKGPKRKICVRCEHLIEDGRWIQMEGGNALCDRCWKNMYLPKCRRCSKTIEKQAVSSSDGQLKGKWHRECFSCFTCEKPFPDKSFYVYDGKPYCAYHYHEENNSLCAAARCGQPIEGPCAVSHAGDRYHPEHFLCEYRGCTERLVEYYEINGRMLCETHVLKVRDEDEDEDDEEYQDAMANKRVTRFIDLAAFSGAM